VLPRTKGIRIRPAPQGSATDLSHQALRHHFLLDIGDGESRERESQTMRKFTSEGFYLNDDAGGEKSGQPAPRLFLKTGQTRQGKSFAPLTNDLPGRVQARGNDVVRQSVRCQEDDLSSNDVSIR
jgi:hypothetical protein